MAKLNIDLTVKDKGSKVITGFGKEVDKVALSSRMSFADFSASLAKGGTAVASILGAAGAAIGAMVQNAAQEAKELQNLATIAETSVEEFSALSYATEKVGISAEKLGDIYKDVQDRIGDFVATGGGPLKDFMENVASQTGLTVDALQELSGPDALIAVTNAMDQANVSAKEQVFYMEAIASDATLLLPLLKNNGKALKEQAAHAKELGVALTDVEAQTLIEAGEATKEMSGAFKGLTNAVSVEFSPVYTNVMNSAANLTTKIKDDIAGMSRSVATFIYELFGTKTEAEEQLADYQSRMAELLERRDRLGGNITETEKKTLNVYRAQVDQLRSIIRMQNRRNNPPPADQPDGAPAAPPAVVHVPGAASSRQTQTGIARNAQQPKEWLDSWRTAYQDRYEIQSRALGVSIELENQLVSEGMAAAADIPMDAWQMHYEDRFELQSRALDAMADSEAEFVDTMHVALADWADGFSATLTDMVFEADVSFGDIAKSFAKMMFELGVQKTISDVAGWASTTFFASAQGNVVSGSGISAYSNSVVHSPTVFPFAKGVGLMGEAGSEAILPLTRMPGGNLGVESKGGGSGVSLNINCPITVEQSVQGTASQKEEQANQIAEAMKSSVQEIIAQEKRYGGILYSGR